MFRFCQHFGTDVACLDYLSRMSYDYCTMPVSYTFEGNLLYFSLISYDSDEIRFNTLKKAISDRRYRPGETRVVWLGYSAGGRADTPSPARMEQILHLIVSNKPRKIAIVVGPYDDHLQVAHDFCHMLQEHGIPCRVFLEVKNGVKYAQSDEKSLDNEVVHAVRHTPEKMP